ncbi:MAG: enoyl-CoA hydratase/isomerase family protein [Bacteroidota bacterium]
MNRYKNIQVELEENVFTLTLNRPQKRNAIDEATMDELLDALKAFGIRKDISLAVLRGAGTDFCAGADLDWMRSTQGMTIEQLASQNMKLQKVFNLWFDLPAFTIAVIQGNIVGGGLGLVASSDLVVAQPGSMFRFSEVTLGLMPATIAPFVLQRTQSRFIRNAMLTALPFAADEALQHGLIDIVADKTLEKDVLERYTKALNKTAREAVSKTKKLSNDLIFNRIKEPMDEYTANLLAEVRKSEGAEKRIAAFFKSLEKKA